MEKYIDKFKNIYEAVPQGKVFRISFDATTKNFRLICRDDKPFNEIREAFSVKNNAAFFTERYGYKSQERIYLLNKFGFFPTGMVFEILSWINTQYGSLSCVAISKNCKQYIVDFLMPFKNIERFSLSNVAEDTGRNNELRRLRSTQISQGIDESKCIDSFEYRDYQKESIEALIFNGYGRGLIEIPTSGGKSFIIANFIWNVWKNIDRNYKTLILVPNIQLVAQFYKDLIDYGLDKNILAKFTGAMSKSEKKENDINSAKIVIANRQYVFKNKNLLPHFDMLVADEAHGCIASSTQEFINSLDAKIKIGCSGTLPRDQYQKWQIIGMFGKIVYTEDITKLQDQGFISKLDITLLKVRDKNVDNDRNLLFSLNTNIKFNAEAVASGESDVMFNDAYNAEKEYFSKWYKDLYRPVFKYLINLNSNTLMLFDRIDIGTNLYEYAKELYVGKNVYYIDGSVNVNEREDIRSKFEKSDGNLLIAQNAVMSTGVNIKRLSNLVFLTSSKSFVRTIQSIGRTLRLHYSKDKAHLIDISWNTKYSQKHLEERLKIYRNMYNKKPDRVVNLDVDNNIN